MDRTMKPITACMNGVEITVSVGARRRIRKMARTACAAVGYLAGITALTCAAVAVMQSVPLWPVLVCGGVSGFAVWRCRG